MSQSYHDDDQVLGKAYDAKLVKRLVPYARPYWRLVLAGVFFMLLAAGAELLGPLIVRETINGPFSILGDSASGEGAKSEAWEILGYFAFGFLGLVLIQFVARFFSAYLFQTLGQRAILDIRQHTYRHIQSLPLRFFDRNPVGRLVTRVTSDIEAIGEVFASGLVQLAGDALIIIGALSLMMMLSWKLGLIVVCAIPVMAVLTWVFRGRARSAFREMRVKLAIVNSYINETIQGWRITRIFGREKKREEDFDKLSADYRDSTYRTVFNFALFFPIVEMAGTATVAAVVWFGARSILEGSMDAGTFFAFFLYTPMMFRPIRQISEKYNVLQSAMASAERLFRILDTANDVKDPEEPKPFNPNGTIEFKNVWFAYVDYDGKPEWVLRDVSFSIPNGTSLALVGATGSGKSTIINLIMRFYDIQKGSITVDGVDIRDVPKDTLRESFGLVLQDVFLFAGTVLDNIRLGNESIDQDRVRASAQTVHADKFIERLPDQYLAPVAERGVTFSAGERQLLAFARALAFDPKILVLDEATANIDSETEALIQDALAKLMQGRTSVVVAHRLSTITSSDNILVLHKGEIVESGNHDALMKHAGRYAKLYQLQFSEQNAKIESPA